MTRASQLIATRLRYGKRLGVALGRSSLIVLKGFEPWAWVALAIVWFGAVLLAFAALREGTLGRFGFFGGATILIAAAVIAFLTAQRWIRIVPGFFGGSVFAGLVNYSGSGVTLAEAATLLASLILCVFLSANLARHSLTAMERMALTAGLVAHFNSLFQREWMPMWAGAMVVFFAIPWLRQRLHSGRRFTNSRRLG